MRDKKRPLTREEFFNDTSSMTAPMVFTIESEGTKKKVFVSKDKYMVKDER